MSESISLEQLLEEQAKPPEPLFVILSTHDEFVRMKLWMPGHPCMCGSGDLMKVPRSAIRSVKKTGKTTHCCGKALQIVTVEFSEEKALTYGELFAALQEKGASPHARRHLRRRSRSRRIPRIINRLHLLQEKPIHPKNYGGGGGSYPGSPGVSTGDPTDGLGFDEPTDDDLIAVQVCADSCVGDYVLNKMPPDLTQAQFWEWFDSIQDLCGDRCLQALLNPDD